MIQHWFGWISVVLCVVLLGKYIGRISRWKALNQFLRKWHKPLGLAVIVVAALHGVWCWYKAPQAVLANATGWLLFLCIVVLARTFYARSKLKAKWFQMHRHWAIVLGVVMVAHVVICVAAPTPGEHAKQRRNTSHGRFIECTVDLAEVGTAHQL